MSPLALCIISLFILIVVMAIELIKVNLQLMKFKREISTIVDVLELLEKR